MRFSITVLALASALARPSRAQPIIYAAYEPHQVGFPWENGNIGKGKLLDCETGGGRTSEWTCNFSYVLSSQPGKPSIREYLAMFSDKYVENNGRFYAVKNSQGNGAMTFSKEMKNGLYEVHNIEGSCGLGFGAHRCVKFKLLIQADNIGQILAAPAKYNPVQVIGVDQVNNRIYGYYPTDNGTWARKKTQWGDAKNGSLRSDTEVIGLSTNGRVFNLWGDFNYAKHDDVECSGAPANIDVWSGFLADYRGIYCPGTDVTVFVGVIPVSGGQLRKLTWNNGGWTQEKLDWAPALTITRFESGIWGITTDGKLLILWNDAGTIRSVPLNDLPSIHGIRAVGGLEDKYVWDSGVLLSNENDVVYNVYWDGKWKEKEIFIDKRFTGKGKISVFFGSHGGEMYMLYGWFDDNEEAWSLQACSLHEVYLYHMKFVGGTERYQAVRIQGDACV